MVQFAELIFRYNGIRIDTTNGAATATNPGGNNPSNETPDKAIDGKNNTKFLDFNIKPLIIDFKKSISVTDYTFVTANDSNGRDPISWTLEGSNDSTTWTTLDTKDSYNTPTGRLTSLSYFTI
jgi:hypothetical protein